MEQKVSKKNQAEIFWVILGVVSAIIVAGFSSLQLGAFVLLFVLLAWWTWLNPIKSVMLLIVVMPILPMLKITQTVGNVTLIKDVIIITLFLKLFLLPLLKRKLPYRYNPILGIVGLLVVWAGINMLRADIAWLGVLRFRDILLYILLYLAALYLPLNRKSLRQLVLIFLLTATIVIMLGAYQWVFAFDSAVLRFDPVRSVWIPRISGVMAHPSIMGQFLAIVIMLTVPLMIVLRQKLRRGLVAMLGLMALVGVYMTYTRAVWIGLAIGLAFMVMMTIYRKWQGGLKKIILSKKVWLVTGGVILLLLIILFNSNAKVFVATIIDPTYASNQERLEFMVRLVGPMTYTQAMLGQGLGDVVAQQFRAPDINAINVTTGDSQTIRTAKDQTLVDNQYLKTFVEMGLVGLLLYSALFVVIGVHVIKRFLHADNNYGYVLGSWMSGFLIFFVVQGLFIDIWEIFPTNALFWLITAIFFSVTKIPAKQG